MILVILDREEEYLAGIGEYFQERLGKFFDIYFFHKKEKFIRFVEQKQKEITVFLSSEELLKEETGAMQVKQSIYLSSGEHAKEAETDVIYKYQSREHIMKEFLKVCRFCTGAKITGYKQDTKVVAVYSPIGRCGKTSLALVMGQVLAETRKVLYISFEEWPGFARIIGEGNGMDISDLVYCLKQKKENIGMCFEGMLVELNGLNILPPVTKAPDIQELEKEELQEILETIVSNGEYDVVLVDVGNRVKNLFFFLECVEQVYMPILKDTNSLAKQMEFMEFLEHSEYSIYSDKIRQCCLGNLAREENTIEELYYGEFGAYVRELLRKEEQWNTEKKSETL